MNDQAPDESSLDSVPPPTMLSERSTLLDLPLYDEEDAGISDHDSSSEEEAQGTSGNPSRQKETRVVPDSEAQARSLAASLSNLHLTLQEERHGFL